MKLLRVRQKLVSNPIADVPAAVHAAARSAEPRRAAGRRRHHRRQPRHRQHRGHHQGGRRLAPRPRRPAVPLPRDGLPQRRHGRGPAGDDRVARPHRSGDGHADPRVDGRREARHRRHRRCVDGSPRLRIGRRAGAQSRQAPHLLLRPGAERPHEDDGRRHGQNPLGRDVPLRPHADDEGHAPRNGPGGARLGQDLGRPGDPRRRLRPDGRAARPPPGRNPHPRAAAPRAPPPLLPPPAARATSTCWWSTRSARPTAAPAWTPT